ncbi:MAG: uroporphyrinogen decarboxylase family protein [Kiritimatiellae bacterium]|nr:uroporphyrinogen decarboxylase family protein [Kiritimatiellia bacterium]
MSFEPDYRNFVSVMQNKRPARLPLYEHIVSPVIMERVLGVAFAGLADGDAADRREFFRHYCRFFREMTYDTVSFEVCITGILPAHGAICGGRPGPIQSPADFAAYPWDELPARFAAHAAPFFDALVAELPAGMLAVGGVGNGVFEISEDLVGLEYLPFMEADEPELYRDLYVRIGDLMESIWDWFLLRYGQAFAACRFGDDLGFKASLLTAPRTVRAHILPQYRRVINRIHAHGRPFLWHSCGCIFEIMEDVLALGIEAKHSNEDAIAPFDQWIERYGARIGLLGGFDMDFLCSRSPAEVAARVREDGQRFRETARGYALGSGNSIPDYVPVANYLAMVEAAQDLRRT